jgi:hypothetical protein
MARLAIIWRNPQFVQQRRLWTPASVNGPRSVYLVAEPVAATQNAWQGLPNLEMIRCGRTTVPAAAKRSVQSGV